MILFLILPALGIAGSHYDCPKLCCPCTFWGATLPAGPNCIASMKVSFHCIGGKLSRAQSPQNCTRCLAHPSTIGDHFWTGIHAQDGIHHSNAKKQRRYQHVQLQNQPPSFPWKERGRRCPQRSPQAEAWLRSWLILQDAAQRNLHFASGQVPSLLPRSLVSPPALSQYFPLWQLTYKSASCECMQQRSKREVLKKCQVISGWGVSSMPAVRRGLTHSGSAWLRVPAPQDKSRLAARSYSHQPGSSLCWSVPHLNFVFQVSAMQFQISPAISHWSLFHVAYPVCRLHHPTCQASTEDLGTSPCPGSSWSSIPPRHWVAGPGNSASLMIFAVTSALHPHQLPDTGGRDTFLFTSGVMAEAHVILTGTRFSISCLNDAATNIYCHKRGYSNTSN